MNAINDECIKSNETRGRLHRYSFVVPFDPCLPSGGRERRTNFLYNGMAKIAIREFSRGGGNTLGSFDYGDGTLMRRNFIYGVNRAGRKFSSRGYARGELSALARNWPDPLRRKILIPGRCSRRRMRIAKWIRTVL